MSVSIGHGFAMGILCPKCRKIAGTGRNSPLHGEGMYVSPFPDATGQSIIGGGFMRAGRHNPAWKEDDRTR